jgi:hypothetical protein
MARTSGIVAWCVAAVGALVLGGCGSARMTTHNINVSLDEALTKPGATPSVQVDIFGVSEKEKPLWESADVSKYWTTTRADVKDRRTFSFGPGKTSPQTLKRSDEVWGKWRERDAMYLVVITDLPAPPGGGAADARRWVLELASDWWEHKKADDPINVTVQRTRLDINPMPKSPAKD